MNIITIDSGTTNTRFFLWKNNVLIAKSSIEIGARDSYENNHSILIKTITNGIKDLLAASAANLDEINYIFASGMITSNLGLMEIEHLEAPVGCDEIIRGIQKKSYKELNNKKIYFIPGVKNSRSLIFHDNDMMRGEESEIMGLLSLEQLVFPCIIVLPGSHCKFVKMNEERKIDFIMTTMSGEILWILTKNTVISKSLNYEFVNQIDINAIKLGADLCEKFGLTRTSFLVRCAQVLYSNNHDKLASFLLGAVSQEDINAFKNSDKLCNTSELPIYIAGKQNMAEALFEIIKYRMPNTKVIQMNSNITENLSSLGAVYIAQKCIEKGSEILNE